MVDVKSKFSAEKVMPKLGYTIDNPEGLSWLSNNSLLLPRDDGLHNRLVGTSAASTRCQLPYQRCQRKRGRVASNLVVERWVPRTTLFSRSCVPYP